MCTWRLSALAHAAAHTHPPTATGASPARHRHTDAHQHPAPKQTWTSQSETHTKSPKKSHSLASAATHLQTHPKQDPHPHAQPRTAKPTRYKRQPGVGIGVVTVHFRKGRARQHGQPLMNGVMGRATGRTATHTRRSHGCGSTPPPFGPAQREPRAPRAAFCMPRFEFSTDFQGGKDAGAWGVKHTTTGPPSRQPSRPGVAPYPAATADGLTGGARGRSRC